MDESPKIRKIARQPWMKAQKIRKTTRQPWMIKGEKAI